MRKLLKDKGIEEDFVVNNFVDIATNAIKTTREGEILPDYNARMKALNKIQDMLWMGLKDDSWWVNLLLQINN